MNNFELRAAGQGYKSIAGLDEVGRGPLAGPVVAAAVILPPDYYNDEINDSKKLAPRKRKRLYHTILQDALAVGLGLVEPELIDRINIHQATMMAMKKAVASLSRKPDHLLIDGIHRLALPISQETIIKGDSLSISIASASIIAKVTRDMIMEEYHHQYPEYNFGKNKGYGTKEHEEAIRSHGQCKIHRRSFRLKSMEGPIKAGDLFEP